MRLAFKMKKNLFERQTDIPPYEVWRETEGKTERGDSANSHLLAHSSNAYNGRGWAMPRLGAGNSMQVPIYMAGAQVLEPSPLSSRVCISRNLQ